MNTISAEEISIIDSAVKYTNAVQTFSNINTTHTVNFYIIFRVVEQILGITKNRLQYINTTVNDFSSLKFAPECLAYVKELHDTTNTLQSVISYADSGNEFINSFMAGVGVQTKTCLEKAMDIITHIKRTCIFRLERMYTRLNEINAICSEIIKIEFYIDSKLVRLTTAEKMIDARRASLRLDGASAEEITALGFASQATAIADADIAAAINLYDQSCDYSDPVEKACESSLQAFITRAFENTMVANR